jgi:hypothetical protein
MPRRAKAYIALIICSGTTILLLAAGSWSTASLRQFAIYLGLAALASTLKIRIPGVQGTLSPNFIFLVLGMAFCSFSEVVVITLAASLVQSLWAAKQPRLVQVTFSAATLIVSASVAYQASYLLLGRSAVDSRVTLIVLAGSLYLPLNTALISAVLGLVDGQPLMKMMRNCYASVFPYFTGGIVFAGLASGTLPRSGMWKGAVALMPIVVLGYLYSMNRKPAATPLQRSVAIEEEDLVEISS